MSDITTTTATTATAVIDHYLAAYGEPDEARRRQLIAAAFVEDATLADPPIDASGHAAIDQVFAAVQSQFPGNEFRRSSVVDEHHGAARYEWELVAPDGAVSIAGTDFVRFAADGRIESVVGFFGPVAAR
jgi:hypothetical protein